MHLLIIGAAGMVGRKLSERLVADGRLGGRAISRLTLHDVVASIRPEGADFALETIASDFSGDGEAARLVANRPDIVFHLAAIVSGEAEEDFDKGYRINLNGTWNLFEALRALHVESGGSYKPRVVFTSSTGVFGGPYPPEISDEFIPAPLTSYGAQKAIGDLLLADYTRRGFFDGIGLRLPTICVRPGEPNKAASGFFSGIIREPLNGRDAVLPVTDDVRHWHASPRSAVGFLLHAATIDGERIGPRRTLNMPGVSCTVGEQIEALRRVAGEAAVARIRREPDARIARIVAGWPRKFDPRRAVEAGFEAETSFDDIVRIYIEDELGGRLPRVPDPARVAPTLSLSEVPT